MAATDSLYSIRPSFAEKFRPATVKTLIGAVLADKLADKSSEPRAHEPPHASSTAASQRTRKTHFR